MNYNKLFLILVLCTITMILVGCNQVPPENPNHQGHDDAKPHTHSITQGGFTDDTAPRDYGEAEVVSSSHDDETGSEVTIRVDDEYQYISGNGLPNHETGDFPNSGNPNSISEQTVELRVPLNPEYREDAIDVQVPGVALNGVFFEPGTAEAWNNDRSSGWNYEALQDELNLGLDFNNAHVQPTGAYHYHGMPTSLVEDDSEQTHSSLVGWAADGFPMYVQYGYSDADDASSNVVELRSSYRLKSGTRNGGPGGSYDGTFTQDFEYVEGLGDLDDCNGRFGATPEYPEGTYAYFITDEFPYISRCLHGEPDQSFLDLKGGPQNGQQGPGGNAPPPRNGMPPPPRR